MTEARGETLARVSNLLPPDVPVMVPAGLLGKIPAQPPGRPRIPDAAIHAQLILYANLACHRHHASMVGIQRAGSLVRGASRSTVLRSWREFSTVAHFWLAIGFRKPHPGKEDWRDYLSEFLAYGESVRLEAESIFAHGQSAPLVDPGRSWKCPSDIALPGVEVSFDPLPEDVLRRLRAYRAPKSSY